LLAEAIAANAGKELDFFQEPELLTRDRFGAKVNIASKHHRNNTELTIPKTKAVFSKTEYARWNF